jgi:hypothetical protein
MHGFVCDEMHQNSFGPHAYQSKWYWTKIYLWFKHSSDNYSGQIMSKGGNVLAHSYRRTNYKKCINIIFSNVKNILKKSQWICGHFMFTPKVSEKRTIWVACVKRQKMSHEWSYWTITNSFFYTSHKEDFFPRYCV